MRDSEVLERKAKRTISSIADSSQTITLADLHDEIKGKYHVDRLSIPTYASSYHEKLAVTFNIILRLLYDDLNDVQQNRNDIVQEMETYSAVSSDNENSSIPIRYVQTEVKLHDQQQLLTSIEQLKVLLHKVSTTEERSSQYGFLLKKLDRYYEIFRNNYQTELPPKNEMQSIHTLINKIRKTASRQLKSQKTIQHELVRKLDVIKKKEELKARAKTNSITEVTAVSSLFNFLFIELLMTPIIFWWAINFFVLPEVEGNVWVPTWMQKDIRMKKSPRIPLISAIKLIDPVLIRY